MVIVGVGNVVVVSGTVRVVVVEVVVVVYPPLPSLVVVGGLWVVGGPDGVVEVVGRVTLPLAGGGGGGGSVWSADPLQATASTADATIAVRPAARPSVVDPSFITPPTSVFTMVANLVRLRASIGLLELPTPSAATAISLDRRQRAEMARQSVAICGRFLTR
ncbi:hypothetical protein [Mycobacterium sp. NPDC004974]